MTIPTTFNLADLTVGEGIGEGQAITAGGLVILGANHNFIGGNYRPPVGELFSVDGFSLQIAATGSGWRNMVGVPVLEEVNGRGMTFSGVVTNPDSVNVANFRLVCGDEIGALVAVPPSTTSAVISLTCDTPTSGDFAAAIQQVSSTSSSTFDIKILCGSFFWSGYTGAQSLVPLAGGFVWTDSSEFQDTFPLSVEQVNRLAGGPLTAWNSSPQCMGGLHWGWAYRSPTTSSTSYAEIGRISAFKRRKKMSIKIAVIGSNATLNVNFLGTAANVVTGSTGGSATVGVENVNVNLSSSIDLSEAPEYFEMIFYMKSTAGSAAGIQDINLILDKS